MRLAACLLVVALSTIGFADDKQKAEKHIRKITAMATDKIGRRKVMILTVLNFSIPTGLMALTPEHGWIFLGVCRFFVGLGVTGLYTVDVAIVQEFVPASKRGWITARRPERRAASATKWTQLRLLAL